jgi:sugar lactone lactonase YvrE
LFTLLKHGLLSPSPTVALIQQGDFMTATTTLAQGFYFTEGPRWRDDKLWFSDMVGKRVYTVDLAGTLETLFEVPNKPSGLGWLPDGRLLVVSMLDRRLLIYSDGTLSEHADLSALASYHCNDMVVAENGNAYVGNFGFDLDGGAESCPAEIILVTPEGKASVAADNLLFPNGTVITPDNKTLIVGETFGARLTAFDIHEDGSLGNRRIWAEIEGTCPDGMCLDEAGGIWMASPVSHAVLRVTEGGEVTDRIPIDNQAYACMLGGPDMRRLFILTASTSTPEKCMQRKDGKIEYVDVQYAAAGRP